MVDLLLVHAHWCGHCRALMPEWNKMKGMLKSHKNIRVHEIESSDSDKDARIEELSKKSDGKKISINGFPTIVRLENGEMTEFKGNRTAAELAKWATKNKLNGGGKRKTKRVRRRKNKTCKKCSFSFF
jgi:thiol-disulfide isomerase/thioredoxin